MKTLNVINITMMVLTKAIALNQILNPRVLETSKSRGFKSHYVFFMFSKKYSTKERAVKYKKK